VTLEEAAAKERLYCYQSDVVVLQRLEDTLVLGPVSGVDLFDVVREGAKICLCRRGKRIAGIIRD